MQGAPDALRCAAPCQSGRGREAAKGAARKGEEVVQHMDDDHGGLPILKPPGPGR